MEFTEECFPPRESGREPLSVWPQGCTYAGIKDTRRASLLFGSQANKYRLSFKSHSRKHSIWFKQIDFDSHISTTYEQRRPSTLECIKQFSLFGSVLSTNLIIKSQLLPSGSPNNCPGHLHIQLSCFPVGTQPALPSAHAHPAPS